MLGRVESLRKKKERREKAATPQSSIRHMGKDIATKADKMQMLVEAASALQPDSRVTNAFEFSGDFGCKGLNLGF